MRVTSRICECAHTKKKRMLEEISRALSLERESKMSWAIFCLFVLICYDSLLWLKAENFDDLLRKRRRPTRKRVKILILIYIFIQSSFNGFFCYCRR